MAGAGAQKQKLVRFAFHITSQLPVDLILALHRHQPSKEKRRSNTAGKLG
jgi:hypothetical protein